MVACEVVWGSRPDTIAVLVSSSNVTEPSSVAEPLHWYCVSYSGMCTRKPSAVGSASSRVKVKPSGFNVGSGDVGSLSPVSLLAVTVN